jgi:hypothetical protein
MTRIHTAFAVVAIGGAGLYAACSKTVPEPDKTSSVESAPPAAAAQVHSAPSKAMSAAVATAAGPEEVAWDAPAAWTSMPNPNSMRKATYKVPRAAGDTEDAELTVSTASGGVEPNIKRWSGQFGNAEAKTESRKVNGLDVTIVEIKGTYSSGGMMGGPAAPKEKWMLLGAVVDGGERQHFFKMTGPEKTVTAARKDFESLVSSLRAK